MLPKHALHPGNGFIKASVDVKGDDTWRFLVLGFRVWGLGFRVVIVYNWALESTYHIPS